MPSFDEASKGEYNSDSYDVTDREADGYNAGLDKEASQGESQQAQSDVSGEEHQGESFLRIPTSDGTNRPRYEKFQVKGEYPQTWDSSEDWQIIVQEFKTKWGELYGFVDSRGDIYLDETVITVEHPIHEYTHLWDRFVLKTGGNMRDCQLRCNRDGNYLHILRVYKK